jgi:hypothetical protein
LGGSEAALIAAVLCQIEDKERADEENGNAPLSGRTSRRTGKEDFLSFWIPEYFPTLAQS